MIGINDNIDAPSRQLFLSKLIVSRWHYDDGSMVVSLAETVAKLLDVLACLLLRVNHHTISSCSHVSMATLQGIVYRLTSYERLATRYNHKVACYLRFLSGTNLGTESLYRVLCLHSIGSEERVLLESHLVLNDDTRNAKTLQCTYSKPEMFQFSTCITIKDYRLGCYFQSIIQVMQTRCYGDYMTPPAKEEYPPQNFRLLDLSKPYREYMKENG